MKLSAYAKSIAAALVAADGSYQVAAADHVVTQAEWVQIVLTVVAALGIVWGVPNTVPAAVPFRAQLLPAVLPNVVPAAPVIVDVPAQSLSVVVDAPATPVPPATT